MSSPMTMWPASCWAVWRLPSAVVGGSEHHMPGPCWKLSCRRPPGQEGLQ